MEVELSTGSTRISALRGAALFVLMAAACIPQHADAGQQKKVAKPVVTSTSHTSAPRISQTSTSRSSSSQGTTSRGSNRNSSRNTTSQGSTSQSSTSQSSTSQASTSQSQSSKPQKVIRNQTGQSQTSNNNGGTTNKGSTSNTTTNPTTLAPLNKGPNTVANPGTTSNPAVGRIALGPGKPANPARTGQPFKPNFPTVLLNNVHFPINRNPYALYIGGVRRFYVPLGVLGVAYIGGSYWDPDGYVSVARRYCSGISENGCTLHWRFVDFADGGRGQQCVQYCPHSGPPPANFAGLPPPPPVPAADSTCQLAIFAQPNFGGSSAPTGDAQPDLAQAGWQNEISSIQVQSGTWDFFADANFGGATMRLLPGPYPTLPPEWNKKIGSFQCVQRGPAPGA